MIRPNKLTKVAVLAAAGSLVLTACGSDSDDGGDGGGAANEAGAQLYFVDGNTADYSKDFDEGTLEGVRATYPGAELGDDFRQRLLEVNPNLKDFTYGPESYDAVITVALAAAAAKSDDGRAIATKMQEISAEGEKCTTYKDCVAMINDGTDIDYDGVSGPIEFSEKGDPSEATIGIYQYGADNIYKNIEYKSGKIAG